MDLKDYLRYDADTGEIFWTKQSSPIRKVGDRAGAPNTGGYRHLQVKGKTYLEHRVAWYLHYGEWPAHQIDHINGDRSDNRISNLRSTNAFQNCQNLRKHRGGKKWGVAMLRDKWCASFRAKGKNHHVGVFDRADLAEAALYGYLKGSGLMESIAPPIKRWEK